MPEYAVYIKWGKKLKLNSDGKFIFPHTIEADSPRGAAEKRVKLLGRPLEYDQVAVLDLPGRHEIKLFDIVEPFPVANFEIVEA